MEAAAETIKELSQMYLPQLPHQLYLDHNWKCRNLPGSDRCEEWHVRPLQYMTLVSVADRGLLITRGYSDVRPDPDPPKPLPKDVNALAKSGGEKKKLSLSDYMNKKSGATISASPPESGSLSAVKKDHERSTSASAVADPRPIPREARKPDTAQSNAESNSNGKPHAEPRDGSRPSKLPPKPASLPPRPPTPDSTKKRAADGDDSRTVKRVKGADAAQRLAEDNSRSQTPRDEARRRKEGSLSQETPKENRLGSSLTNGRNMQKPTAVARSASPLPPGRSRGTSINGIRPSDGARGASSRMDASQKSSVPPLLSPLHLEFEGNRDRDRDRDRPAQKPEKRRSNESVEVAKPPKANTKQDATAVPKKIMKPSKPSLPALLSPTLPAEIEAELDRMQQKSPQKSSEEPKRDTRIVTFKVPKRLRQDFRRVLAITSSRKEPQRPSSSGGLQQAPAKKRPISSGERELGDSLASKKPRTSDTSRTSALPSTPSKKTTAMSRVSSSNSAAHTPGDAVTSTPSRHAVNGEPKTAAEQSRIDRLREKEYSLLALGKRLKRRGDLAMKGRSDPVPNGGTSRVVESAVISGYISITESIVAFMSAFDAQDGHRSLSGKGLDPQTWISLLPLLEFLQKDMRRYDAKRLRPLSALLSSIQGVAYDHIITSYALCENQLLLSSLPDALGQARRRNRAWQMVRESSEGIDSRLLIDVRQWHLIEDIVDMVLRAMRRWCEGENIDWTPEVPSR